jgi:hypothetical protein
MLAEEKVPCKFLFLFLVYDYKLLFKCTSENLVVVHFQMKKVLLLFTFRISLDCFYTLLLPFFCNFENLVSKIFKLFY